MHIRSKLISPGFWKRFLSIFTDEPLVEQIHDNFQEMLSLAQTMYISVTGVLLDPEETTLDSIHDSFFLTDQKINALEQQIRREVLIHLSVSSRNEHNQTTYLMLLNLVKDAERLGDYSKNIYEVFERSAEFLPAAYRDKFEHLRGVTIRLFSEIRTALATLDAKLANRCGSEAGKWIQDCGSVVNELMDHPERTANPVAVALLFRYQKRILNHLRKLAVAQFTPFDKFGTAGKNQAK
ncbi:MAG: PhoU domain-containing protein [Myxococcales bacterium]|nr:MAG: PhoU domain-containing protein [Myxococcales bacterium]